jgi:L-ribulose-5-phosphate 3-epimerase
MTRRTFLAATGSTLALTPAAVRARTVPVKIGITDWNLNLGASPEAVTKAHQLGFAGVQVSFGRQLVNGKLPLDNREVIGHYLKLAAEQGVTIDGTCVDRLHDNGLKSDPLALRWVSDSIRLTKELNTKVLLVPFFGKWALKNDSEIARVGDALRELAPEAEKAGIILGLEDTVSAEDNARMLDMSRSPNVKVYYDVGNSHLAGFDMAKEIRWLGKDRICQFHFKDNPHLLGEGTIEFEPILRAIDEIGWSGWANLETDARPGNLDTDLKQNLSYIQAIEEKVYS